MNSYRPLLALWRLTLAASAAAALSISCRAAAPDTDITLAPVFGDHAVLQRGKPVPVWGLAGPAEPVTVTFRGQTAATTAGADGSWKVSIGALEASAEGSDLVVAGRGTVALHDVVVGDVWLCSGQSNMEFTVDDGGFTYHVDNAGRGEGGQLPADPPAEGRARTVAASPARTVKTGGWELASPDTVGGFTAVGYFFARDIHRAVGVPVGIIDSCWGGTPVESWMSDAARASTSIAATLDARWAKAKAPSGRRSGWPSIPPMEAAWDKAEQEARPSRPGTRSRGRSRPRPTTRPTFRAASSMP
jgi:sialate O-acetylesterase